jgi:probable F420-dependent oxidoreductase
MYVDAALTKDLDDLVPDAAACAREGYDGLWVGESQHDPFLLSLRAAQAAPGVRVGTSIAIAFGRSPLTLAHSGYDLARYTDGKFVLGLGSQIRPHIERRFSMPWSHPARRMREMILALRAIWAAWHEEAPLRFEGEFYRHTLMTPNFTPPRHPAGPPPVYLAGVGERMTEVAGEVADGFLGHPFSSPRFLREVTLPALERGRARASGERGRPELCGFVFVAAGRDTAELDAAIKMIKYRIAFYGSTPAYRPVLDLHGWADLQPGLNSMTKQGRWDEIAAMVPDEVLHEFAVVGTPAEAGATLAARYGDLIDRVTLNMPYPHDLEVRRDVARAVRAHPAR